MSHPVAHTIDHFFAQRGSPLAGTGHLFVRFGARFGVDPIEMAAIAAKETQGGLTGTGRPSQGYNITGIGGVGNFRRYPGYRAAIKDEARTLGQPGYRGKPLSVQTARWVAGTPPTATTAGYTRDVAQFMRLLGGSANAMGAPPPPMGAPRMPRMPGVPKMPSMPDATPLLQSLGDTIGVQWSLPSLNIPDVPGQPRIPGPPGKVIGKAGPQGIPVVASGKVTPTEQKAVALIHQYLGRAYVYGGRTPQQGFDCSGLVQWVYGRLGVKLGNTTYDQIKQGRPVKYSQLRPGDIVFFYGPNPHHEGLYIGGGKFIHAPHTGDVIKISDLRSGHYRDNFAAARRVA